MNRVKKVVLGIMMLGIAGIAFAQSQQEPLEEVITIETFFPAPWAEFDEMRLYPTTREAGYCDNDRIGYMYYDDNGTGATQYDDAVKVCKGTELGWQELGGLWTATGNDIYNSNSGNVGIGTANPGAALLAVGAPAPGGVSRLYVEENTAGTASVMFKNPGAGDQVLLIEGNDGVMSYSKWRLRANQASGDLRISTGDETTIMTLKQGGNVGIGTTSPDELLVIGSGVGSYSGNRLTIGNTGGLSGINLGENASERAAILWDNTNNHLEINTDTDNTFIIKGSNVGIGTVSPTQKLDVVGNIKASGTICDGSGNCIGGGGGLGIGQSWVVVTGARAIGTTYTNNTGKPIQVMFSAGAGGQVYVGININGTQILTIPSNAGTGTYSTGSFVVPSGSTYSLSNVQGSPNLYFWSELR